MLKNKLNHIVLAVLFITIISSFSGVVLAQDEATGSGSKQEKIDIIKEKVASKVAELTKAIAVGIEGRIDKIEEGILTLDINGKQKTINTDTDTVFSEQNSDLGIDELEFDDLKKDDEVLVIGEEQIGTDIINAKLITTSVPVLAFTGKLKSVDSKKFTFIVIEGKDEYTFDFEKYTDSFMLIGGKLESARFSKIEEGGNIQLLASPQENSETRFTALRLIIL